MRAEIPLQPLAAPTAGAAFVGWLRKRAGVLIVFAVLFLLWEAHYAQRTLVYPFLMRVREGDTMPFSIATRARSIRWPMSGCLA